MHKIFLFASPLTIGGWDPTIVISTAIEWGQNVRWFIKYRTFCYRKNDYIEVRYDRYPKEIGFALGLY